MRLEDTFEASYKGVSFIVKGGAINGGGKYVKHSFPDSDAQNIEYLGLMPRSFSLSAIVTGTPPLREDYIENRDRLLIALEDGEEGVLVHPFYGTIQRAVAVSYTVDESFTRLGSARFSINFELNTTDGVPEEIDDTDSTIVQASQSLMTRLSQNVEELFEVSGKYRENFTDAVFTANQMVLSFTDNTSFLQVEASKINEFTAELDDFSNSVASLVNDPAVFGASIISLFNEVNELYSTFEATYDVLIKFFDFGEARPELEPTTAGLIEQDNNRAVLNTSMQASALTLAYENAIQIDFQTVDQISAVQNTLEAQFQKIYDGNAVTEDTVQQLSDYRSRVNNFFNERKLTASRIITVNTKLISSRLLSYQYYGSSEVGLNLANLNETMNVNFLDGSVEVFTQ